jgi:multidrug efflux pump
MMSARLLKKKKRENKFYQVTERFYENLTNGYNRTLIRFMRYRWIAQLEEPTYG